MGENAVDHHGDDAVPSEVGAIDAGSSAQPMLMAVVNGADQFAALSASDRSKAHELIEDRIAERAAQERFGEPAGGRRPLPSGHSNEELRLNHDLELP
jgi:hypothetical protein